ncbi:MAG: hypothetical protein L6R38_001936 [Xanthoria sp. 2 TBL-2021]|nr:MAG: hypothetical protein L6R38_001936 [Xanthoria sp. 2 TBL-2021]
MDVQPAFPTVRACIFDVDGLLINSEDIYTEIYNKILHSYGKPSLKWTTKALQQSRGKIGHERLISSTSLPLTVAEFQAEVANHHAPFTNCHPLPGVLTLLQTLSTASPPIYLAMASSTTKSFFATKTSHLPSLTSYFAPRTCLFRDDEDMQTKKGKPAGDIFLLAMERINASLTDANSGGEDIQRLRAGECLVFEDSIAGVAAGRAAGMRVCWVPHEGLREVCKGLEREVLAGNMNEVEERLLALEADRASIGPEVVGPIGEGKADGTGRVDRLVSEDGWAEMIGSLEQFDYARYGIRVQG